MMAATSALKAVAGALMRCRPGGAGRRAKPAAATAPFDYYVMTLSWSPGFCDLGGDEKSPQQCAAGAGDGFVVHGLWPNNRMSADPENCDPATTFSRRARGGSRALSEPRASRATNTASTGPAPDSSAADYFAAVRYGARRNRHPAAAAERRANGGVISPEDDRSRPSSPPTPISAPDEHGDHLRPRRTHRRAHLPFEGPEGLRASARRWRDTPAAARRSPSRRCGERRAGRR